jgi:hypothetical protein
MTPSTLLIMLLAFGALTPEVNLPPPLSAEEVLESPARYDRKVITLSGWFRTGRETSTIQGHGGAIEINVEKIIWVDTAKAADFEQAPIFIHKPKRGSKTEPLTAEEKKVYERLMGSNWPCPVPVTVKGEFQTSATREFGHLSAFKNRIILYKVLEIGKPEPCPLSPGSGQRGVSAGGTDISP